MRIAIHYDDTDSFEDNILAGGLVGEDGEGDVDVGDGSESMKVLQ